MAVRWIASAGAEWGAIATVMSALRGDFISTADTFVNLPFRPCFQRRFTRIARTIRMLRQFIFGAAISGCNIAIHALVMLTVIGVARIIGDMTASRQSLRLTAVMIATVLVLMIAHFAEVLVWALSYAIVGAAPEGADRIYFAFVNYTTLGYGDVTPVERWRLLGPMTAMNGVLMFGWSTAVIFEVLQKVLMEITKERS